MKYPVYLLFLLALVVLPFSSAEGSPLITSIEPAIAPSSGGTVVTINGIGFAGVNAVNFGNTPAMSFNVMTDNVITATTPAHIPQVVSVSVLTSTESSPLTSDCYFTFQGSRTIYLANCAVNTFSVIDAATDTVIATPTVGSQPNALASLPDGTKVYIANFNDGTVSVIDAATQTVTSSITLGGTPNATAITPDGAKAYVVNLIDNNVGVIDIATNTATSIAVGDLPVTVAIIPDGTKAYVANLNGNTISAINIATQAVVSIIVGNNPMAIAITPDGSKAYVVNSGDGTVSVINTVTDLILATIPVGEMPLDIAITPDGSRAYVTNATDDTVSVINTATNSIISPSPISVGGLPNAIAITPDGTKAYVANFSEGTVSVINLVSNMVSTTITVGISPLAIAITPEGTKAYVINFDSNTVSVINTITDTIIGMPIPIGDQTTAIAIPPDQAPLAKFKANVALADLVSTFDASASVSPIGTIASYSWDFGDGNTATTSLPTITHIYSVPGTYLVSLRVTNSAGTSIQQIFNISSFFNTFSNANNSTFITHQGGPTALATQLITVLPPPPPVLLLPPRDLQGKQVKNIFAMQTEYINILTWKVPFRGITPVAYRMYRDPALTKLVVEISANERLRFEDRYRKKGKTYHYFVVSVDEAGNVSVPAKLSVRK